MGHLLSHPLSMLDLKASRITFRKNDKQPTFDELKRRNLADCQ
ncbi:hypothetical protein [Rubritalea tangerina]